MKFNSEKIYALSLLLITAYIFLPYNFQSWNSVLFNFETIYIGLIGCGITASVSFAIKMLHRNHFKLTLIDLVLGIYFLFQLASYLLVNSFSVEYLFFAENLLLCFLYLSYRCLEQRYFPLLFYAVILCAIIQILYGILHQTHMLSPGFHISNISGSFINQGPFSCFIAIAITTGLGLLNHTMSRSSTSSKVLNGIIVFAVITFWLILLNTFSRAAILAATIPTVYFHFTVSGVKKKFNRLRQPYRYSIIGLIIILGTSALFSMYYSKKSSADGRLLIWEVTMTLVQEKPILGHGVDQFEHMYMNEQANFLKTNQSENYDMLAGENNYSFNELLRLLQEQGVVGLSLFIFLFILITCSSNHHKDVKSRNDILTSKGVICTIFIFGLFSYPWEIIEIKCMAVACVAIVASYSKSHLASNSQKATFLIGILTFFLSAFAIFRTVKHHPSFVTWNTSFASITSPIKPSDAETLKYAYPTLKRNPYFLAYYGQILAKVGRFPQALTHLHQSNELDPAYYKELEIGKIYLGIGQNEDAEKHWTKASAMIPSKFEAPYLILKMHYINHNYLKVETLASDLLRKRIKVYSVEVFEMIEDIKSLRRDANNQKAL